MKTQQPFYSQSQCVPNTNHRGKLKLAKKQISLAKKDLKQSTVSTIQDDIKEGQLQENVFKLQNINVSDSPFKNRVPSNKSEISCKRSSQTDMKKVIPLSEDLGQFLKNCEMKSGQQQSKLEDRLFKVEKDHNELKKQSKIDNEKLKRQMNDQEKKFSQILQIMLNRQKELEQHLNKLQKNQSEIIQNKKEQNIVQQLKEQTNQLMQQQKLQKFDIHKLTKEFTEPKKTKFKPHRGSHTIVSPISINNIQVNATFKKGQNSYEGLDCEVEERSQEEFELKTDRPTNNFEILDQIPLRNIQMPADIEVGPPLSMADLDLQNVLQKSENNIDSSSDDQSLILLNAQPLLYNKFDCQSPKLLNYLGSSSKPIKSRDINIDHIQIEQEDGYENIDIDQEKTSEEDHGEILDDDIAEKSLTHTNKTQSSQNQQVTTYKTKNPLLSQFIKEQQKSSFVKEKTPRVLKSTAKEILSLKGSKCSCNQSKSGIGSSAKKSRLKINKSITNLTQKMGVIVGEGKCSTYCKNLSSNEQNHIVKVLMKRFAEQNNISDESLIYIHQANLGKVGEKKYIVSSQWWRKWCDYVNYGENMQDSGIVNFNQIEKPDQQKICGLFSSYEKPGLIENQYSFQINFLQETLKGWEEHNVEVQSL